MSPTLLSAARSTLVTAWFCLSGLAVAAGSAPSAADIIASQGAQAMQGKKVTVCVFDPLGKNGPAYASAKEYMLEGKRWGINATVEAYVSEGVLVDDLKAGQCDWHHHIHPARQEDQLLCGQPRCRGRDSRCRAHEHGTGRAG